MPRHVSKNKEQLMKWCEEIVVKGESHRVFSTNNAVILEPKKSTSPRRYGYLKTTKANEIAKEISEKFELVHIELEAYEWDTEKSPGIKMPQP